MRPSLWLKYSFLLDEDGSRMRGWLLSVSHRADPHHSIIATWHSASMITPAKQCDTSLLFNDTRYKSKSISQFNRTAQEPNHFQPTKPNPNHPNHDTPTPRMAPPNRHHTLPNLHLPRQARPRLHQRLLRPQRHVLGQAPARRHPRPHAAALPHPRPVQALSRGALVAAHAVADARTAGSHGRGMAADRARALRDGPRFFRVPERCLHCFGAPRGGAGGVACEVLWRGFGWDAVFEEGDVDG